MILINKPLASQAVMTVNRYDRKVLNYSGRNFRPIYDLWIPPLKELRKYQHSFIEVIFSYHKAVSYSGGSLLGIFGDMFNPANQVTSNFNETYSLS